MESLTQLDCSDLVAITRDLAVGLSAHSAGIDRLDVWGSADGDTGSNLAAAAHAMTASLDAAPAMAVLAHWADAIRGADLTTTTGRSGALLTAFLRAVAAETVNRDVLGPTAVALAFEAGAEAMSTESAPPSPMVAVADAAAIAALRVADADGVLSAVVTAAADAALDALEGAASHEALEREGVVDAGAAGMCVLFDVIVGHVTDEPLAMAPPGDPTHADQHWAPTPHFTLRCRLELDDSALDIDVFRSTLESVADVVELVPVEAARVDVRASTDDLGPLIEAACTAGRPVRVRIEDHRIRG